MRKFIPLVLLLFMVYDIAFAATWYVRQDGNDSTCDGTQDEAAGDGTCAWATLEKALLGDAITQGDTVIVGRDGETETYVPTARLTLAFASNSDAMTVIQEHDGATVIIDCPNITGRYIDFTEPSTWQGFDFTDSNSYAVSIGNLQNNGFTTAFENCSFVISSGTYGIFNSTADSAFDFVLRKSKVSVSASTTTAQLIRLQGSGTNTASITVETCDISGVVYCFNLDQQNVSVVSKNNFYQPTVSAVFLIVEQGCVITSRNDLFHYRSGTLSSGRVFWFYNNTTVSDWYAADPYNRLDIKNSVIADSYTSAISTTYAYWLIDVSTSRNYYPLDSSVWVTHLDLSGSAIAAGDMSAMRGLASDIPTSTDLNGDAWRGTYGGTGIGDIGCYTNPAQTPYSPVSGLAILVGDSISVGLGGESTFWQYKTGAATQSAISGIGISSVQYLLRKAIAENQPQVVALNIGVNNIMSGTPTNADNDDTAAMILHLIDVIKSYGVKAVVWGPSPESSTPTNADYIADAVVANCPSGNVVCGDISSHFQSYGAGWGTYYYTDIDVDVHPNATGKAEEVAYLDSLYDGLLGRAGLFQFFITN